MENSAPAAETSCATTPTPTPTPLGATPLKDRVGPSFTHLRAGPRPPLFAGDDDTPRTPRKRVCDHPTTMARGTVTTLRRRQGPQIAQQKLKARA